LSIVDLGATSSSGPPCSERQLLPQISGKEDGCLTLDGNGQVSRLTRLGPAAPSLDRHLVEQLSHQ
jgi:hypothetical protein